MGVSKRSPWALIHVETRQLGLCAHMLTQSKHFATDQQMSRVCLPFESHRKTVVVFLPREKRRRLTEWPNDAISDINAFRKFCFSIAPLIYECGIDL